VKERSASPARTNDPPARRASDGPGGAFLWSELERATDSPTICGNAITLEFDGGTTFPAWLEAIASAERFVYFENYLVRNDEVGQAFREALIAKAGQGVPVYVIYDWVGCWATPDSFWRPMRRAGVQVHAFNSPRMAVGNPFGALQRDHRKLVVVDGEIAHVSGMCVGEEWAGTPTEAPWRDTGLAISGPAARSAALAFERLWNLIAPPISLVEAPRGRGEGGAPVWLIEGEPGRARVYRTLHLEAARARRSIWITDAYFVAPRPVSEALAAAAAQGVDVRILVPAHNNWPIVGSMSRGGYRFLLERGVRLFEWQGPMIHAKTSVVDGAWCRVGSSNLNSASLLGNWELDVGVLDEGLGDQLRGLFIADLASSTEIVLPGGTAIGGRAVSTAVGMNTSSLDPEGSLHRRIERQMRASRRSARRVSMASVIRAGEAFGDALADNRLLGREDRTVLGMSSVFILIVAALAALAPALVGWGVALVAGWLGFTMAMRAYLQARRARRLERSALQSIEDDERRPTSPRDGAEVP
jgi:cardiolipin synthase